MTRKAARLSAALALAIGLGLTAQGQSSFQTGPCDDHHGNNSWSFDNGSKYTHCEERTISLPAGQGVEVEAVNGGIAVVGEERSDIQLEARVFTTGSSQAEADKRAQDIKIQTEGNHIKADVPTSWMGHHSEAVSFSLRVPHHYSVKAKGENGAISVASLQGSMNLRTENGGIVVKDCAGDINSRTENGSINITVTGDSFEGAGIVAETTNGSANLTLPEDYSAHLEAGVVNGRLRIDFPVTLNHFNNKEISTDIGKGGPPIRLHTVNGSVTIRRTEASKAS